jgi:hypothetical protein
MVLAFIWLTADAVWRGTPQRLGTKDEIRVLIGVIEGMIIAMGLSWLIV